MKQVPVDDFFTVDSAAAWLDLDPRKIARELQPTAQLVTTKGIKTRPLFSRDDLVRYARRVGADVPA